MNDNDRKIINSFYENFKNSPKKLKIVCDWDEVVQATEPYVGWKALKELSHLFKGGFHKTFEEQFKDFWNTELVDYFHYGSKIKEVMFHGKDHLNKYLEIKNSPNFYQQAPFLTIAEDLVKLIKEDKVEQIIFLVHSKVLDVKGEQQEKVIRDERIGLIFKETFGKFLNCSLRRINYVEDDGGGVEVQYKKADWIKSLASDFDIVIDDNPKICKSLVKEFANKVIAPYYPATENQHDEDVLLVKNEVSGLKREDFKK